MRENTIVLDQDYRSKKKISWLYNKSVWVSNSKYKEWPLNSAISTGHTFVLMSRQHYECTERYNQYRSTVVKQYKCWVDFKTYRFLHLTSIIRTLDSGW